MRHVPAIDSTAIRTLRDVARRRRGDGIAVLTAEVDAQPMEALRATPAMEEMGSENFAPSMEFALVRALECLRRTTPG